MNAAILDRVTDVQNEGGKLRTDNEMLQTCTFDPSSFSHPTLSTDTRDIDADIDNLTRNKYVPLGRFGHRALNRQLT